MTPRNARAVFLAFFAVSIAIFLLSFAIPQSQGANILGVSYAAFPSHTFVFSKIGKALAAKGHNFTQIVSSLNIENLVQDESINYIVYDHPFPPEEFSNFTRDVTSKPAFQQTLDFVALSRAACHKLFTEENRQKLKSMEIDLVMVDTAFTCSFLVADFINASKRVIVSPAGLSDPWVSETHGIPVNPAYVPVFGSGISNVMNFEQRLKNFVSYILAKIVLFFQVVLKRDGFYKEMNVTRNVLSNTQGIIILPTLFGFEYPRSISANAFFVGPLLAEDPTKPLHQDYQSWLNSSDEQVVIISMGSAVYTSEYVVKTMAGAVDRLIVPDNNGKKYRVIWKLREDGQEFLPKQFDKSSVLIDSWIPQNDLLAQKKVIAFVTHGGLNGAFESIFHKVPMVCIPFFGDQPDNCAKAETANVAVTLTHQEPLFTPELLYTSILKVINEPIYQDSVDKLSELVRASGRTDEVVQRIEHVLRFGHQHLMAWQLWELSWYQLYCLDSLAFLLVASFLAVGVPFLLFSYCFFLLCRRTVSPKTKTD
jgi:UDP:flavonoid glycosyltransferase YjiC (YdhE family)